VIREANENDCVTLAALSLDVWLKTYAIDGINSHVARFALSTFTESSFKETLLNKKYKLLVYVDDRYLRGYALVNLESSYQSEYSCREKNGFEIEKLYVHTAFQGLHIGSRLLSEIQVRYGDTFWLYTWVRNESMGFYKKFGFKDVGEYHFEFGNETIENRVLVYRANTQNK